MTSILIAASLLEIGLVVLAAVIFLAMVVTALAVVVWSVAGLVSATHQYPSPHR